MERCFRLEQVNAGVWTDRQTALSYPFDLLLGDRSKNEINSTHR